jgi:glycosyltransferase involved in cell wall biosynthesis
MSQKRRTNNYQSGTRMVDSLRVLHVISGDLWAGAESMADTLIRGLHADPRFDLSAVLFNDGRLADRLREAGVPTQIIHESEASALKILYRLYRHCSRLRPHILHTHGQKENVIGSIVAKATGARSLRTVHGWLEFPNLGMRLDKRLFRRVDYLSARYLQDRVIAVSAELKRKLEKQIPSELISIIENGIDVAAVRREAKTGRGLAIAPWRRAIGIVARLVPVKRHDRFIAAAAILLDAHGDDYEFHIIGSGPLYDSLKRQLIDANLSERITLHGFRADVPSLVSSLDAIVVCSEHEGIPMNVLEAAAIGVPIVTTPLPSIRAILAQGASGTVCDDATPAAIARGIRQCLATDHEDSCLDVETWMFSQQSMVRRYAAIYKRLASHQAQHRKRLTEDG